MRRRAKTYTALALTTCLITGLTACGELPISNPLNGSEQSGSTENPGQESMESQEQVQKPEEYLSPAELEFATLSAKYKSGDFDAEEYRKLASLYGENGSVKAQRNLLEEGYRILRDDTLLKELQGLWVNLSEADTAVLREVSTLESNLSLEETYGEAISQIISEPLFETLMPTLYEGKRNYYRETEGKIVTTLQAGYNEDGSKFIEIYIFGKDNKVLYLQSCGGSVRLMSAAMEEGEFTGEFESWVLEESTGSILHETGTLTNGHYTGAYSAKLRKNGKPDDLFSMWSNRETMEYREYKGDFDEEGKSTLKQPDGKTLLMKVDGLDYGTYLVYAYSNSRTKCLYFQPADTTEAGKYTLTAKDLGWSANVRPDEIPTYEPAEINHELESDYRLNEAGELVRNPNKQEMSQTPKIRVYGGQIQILIDGSWVSLGTMDELAGEDPVKKYEEEAKQELAEKTPTPAEPVRETGTVATPTPKPTPTPTPTPTPQPTPQPPTNIQTPPSTNTQAPPSTNTQTPPSTNTQTPPSTDTQTPPLDNQDTDVSAEKDWLEIPDA